LPFISSMPVRATEFRRTLPERMQRDMTNTGKLSTVPSKGSSGAVEAVAKAEALVRLEGSTGVFDAKGSGQMAWAAHVDCGAPVIVVGNTHSKDTRVSCP
jgi:hypothetical protein